MYCRSVLFVFLMLSGFICEAQHSRQKRVIGGTTVSKGEHPWLVWLSGKIVTRRLFGIIPISHRHVFCGGSLINDRWVLTAAHCFGGGIEARDVDAWEVRLAVVDIKVTAADRLMDIIGQTIRKNDWRLWEMDVAKIVIHPGYNKDDLWFQDIALVQLEDRAPVQHSKGYISKVKLPDSMNDSFPQIADRCVLTGWGCTSAGGSVSRYAMSIELPIVHDDVCDNVYYPKSMLGRLCAGYTSGEDAKGVCPGDSGGPLICRNSQSEWIQVGIASFARRLRPDMFPAVFTRVSNYVKWIESYIS